MDEFRYDVTVSSAMQNCVFNSEWCNASYKLSAYPVMLACLRCLARFGQFGRFWKGGFWKNHLAGKPYHISALYLVDLKRFRQIAAGDNYR